MSWFYLIVAGFLEIGWAVGLKYTHGFTRPWPTAAVAVSMIASLYFLSLALKDLPLGTAYAFWTGIGAVGTVIVGMAILGEPRDSLRLASVGLIVAGLVGLKLS
jgi:quaternary ammonium compound-resistance protein SugE